MPEKFEWVEFTLACHHCGHQWIARRPRGWCLVHCPHCDSQQRLKPGIIMYPVNTKGTSTISVLNQLTRDPHLRGLFSRLLNRVG